MHHVVTLQDDLHINISFGLRGSDSRDVCFFYNLLETGWEQSFGVNVIVWLWLQVQYDTVNPAWEQSFDFNVPPEEFDQR